MSDFKSLNSLKLNLPSFEEAADIADNMSRREGHSPETSCISQRVGVPMDRVDGAISFWKALYFAETVQGRLLSGIEAYELGDEKIHHSRANKTPYIAMCNLMALEAIKMMGDAWPTMETAENLMFGSEREQDIADFWKQTFAPTSFQANWAWAAVMAVLAGEPSSTSELLYQYREQLPSS